MHPFPNWDVAGLNPRLLAPIQTHTNTVCSACTALRPSVLRASDTLRFHNRQAGRECTHTEGTLFRSERMTDGCATHFRTTLRNLLVPPVGDLRLAGILVGVCPKAAEVKGDIFDFLVCDSQDLALVLLFYWPSPLLMSHDFGSIHLGDPGEQEPEPAGCPQHAERDFADWCPPAHSFVPLRGRPCQECAHLRWSLFQMKPKKQKCSRKRAKRSFFPTLSSLPACRLFKVVLGVAAARPAVIGPLFHLQHHLRFFPSQSRPSPLSFRKCWTSARTEGPVKSWSTAASLGPTSVPEAPNTSAFGTNADPVSGSSPRIQPPCVLLLPPPLSSLRLFASLL